MPDALTLASLTVSFVATLMVRFVAILIVSRFMRQHGITEEDVHKLSKPEIPEMCGAFFHLPPSKYSFGLCYWSLPS
jgi:UDP-N-acetylmuramyl pentapeptide phosphotransferase/UDP-N-acetylglucosamine-1-phosphate transferase